MLYNRIVFYNLVDIFQLAVYCTVILLVCGIYQMEVCSPMKRITIMALLALFTALPVVAQQKPQTEAKPAAAAEADDSAVISDQAYKEVTVEDFETNVYADKNIEIIKSKDQSASLSIRSEYPAPIKDSKKYLGVKIHGRVGDWATINPPKDLAISDHCQSISVWVYGKNFSGELYAVMKDADGQIKKLSFGKLNFLGWRKLAVTIPKDFSQEDKYLSQPRSIYIVKIQYNPGRTEQLKETDWDYFYLDDITAKVRKKYVDKQSDAW